MITTDKRGKLKFVRYFVCANICVMFGHRVCTTVVVFRRVICLQVYGQLYVILKTRLILNKIPETRVPTSRYWREGNYDNKH